VQGKVAKLRDSLGHAADLECPSNTVGGPLLWLVRPGGPEIEKMKWSLWRDGYGVEAVKFCCTTLQRSAIHFHHHAARKVRSFSC